MLMGGEGWSVAAIIEGGPESVNLVYMTEPTEDLRRGEIG